MDSSTDSDNCSIATSGLGCGTNSRTFIHASSTEVERGSGWVGDAEGASTRLANNDGIDQALDNALDFYQADMSQGMLDGAKAAETSSVAIASAMGVQRGGTVGIELGFYRGIASAWAARGHMLLHANPHDLRAAKLIRVFSPILEMCGLALAHDMDTLFSNLPIIRQRFKTACTACSLSTVKFEDGASNAEDFSF